MKFKDIRRQIFLAFLIYSAISLLVSMISFWLFQSNEKAEKLSVAITDLYITATEAAQLGKDFILYETNSEAFFNQGGSTYLTRYNELQDSIGRQLTYIATLKQNIEISKEKVQQLEVLLRQYDIVFREIIIKTKQRGYKDFGAEGSMRMWAHALEDKEKVPLQLLNLRRYEKDFIMRQDTGAIASFKTIANQYRISIQNSSDANKDQKLKILNKYIAEFEKLARLDQEIGKHNNQGLNLKLNQTSEKIAHLVESLRSDAAIIKSDISDRISTIFLVVITISVILILTLAMLFRYITERESGINITIDSH